MTHEDWTQAQYSVLGSALIEPSLVPKVLHQTRPADFSGPCKTVYAAMRKLFQEGKPVDVITLAAALGKDYRQFLVEMMQITPTAANLDGYIGLVRERSRIMSVQDIANQILTTEDIEQIRSLLEKANGLMVDKSSLRITTMEDALKSFMARHTGEVKYLTWPISELNDRLYSEPGDFILVGGRPSAGKSALSLQCAEYWAKNMKVGFFSLETNPEKLFDRLMASHAGLSMDVIKRNTISGSQWDNICAMTNDIISLNFEIVLAANMTPSDIKSVTMMRGYQLIIIDYVQLIQSTGSNRTEQVTNISLALHRMAQDMRVTVVALSQLKRKGDDSAPDSSDLRESGQLEQDADIIMMLKLEDQDKPDGDRKMYITKNKEGTCPMIRLAFDGSHQRFSKANRSGDIVSKYTADGKKARQNNRAQATAAQQMSVLPGDTPIPFTEEARG